MFARLTRQTPWTRIMISRVFVLCFFLLLMFTESAHKKSIFSGFLFLAGVAMIGIATIGRLWCAIYIGGYKDTELATLGPYSMTRNPLYFCSFLGFTGVGFITETLSFGLAFAAMFSVVYLSFIRREEEYLRAKFGSHYLDYCARTPRFFPSLKGLKEPATWTVHTGPFRRTMIDAIWFVWVVGIVKLIDALQAFKFLKPIFRLP